MSSTETMPQTTTVVVVQERQRGGPKLIRVIMRLRCSISLIITGVSLIVGGISLLALGDDDLVGAGIGMLVGGILLTALASVLTRKTIKKYKAAKQERAADSANTVTSVSVPVPPGAHSNQPGVQPGGVYPPGVYPPQAGGAHSMGHPQQPPAYSPNASGYPPQP